jgi:hypothetical protein
MASTTRNADEGAEIVAGDGLIFSAMTPIFNFDDAEKRLSDFEGDSSARIAERNRLTNGLFEEGVEKAGWRRLRRGDKLELPADGSVVVLGVVVWNSHDREILNIAAEHLRDPNVVFIFDLDEVHSAEQLHALMPLVDMPLRTPVAAAYKNCRLIRDASGSDVRDFIGTVADELS